MMARLIQIIETEELRWAGTQENPTRRVKQFWSVDGELLMERDHWREEQIVRDARIQQTGE